MTDGTLSDSASALSCPDCGASNRPQAGRCQLCGSLLPARSGLAGRGSKVLRRTDFVGAARANQARTNLLIWLLLLVSTGFGYLLGWNLELLSQPPLTPSDPIWLFSSWGILAALALLLLGIGWSALALRVGDKVVLRLTGAQPVSDDTELQLHNVVEEMAVAAGLPKPSIYILETAAMNAFATGMSPRRSAICVTRGLLQNLDREELQGVVAHELGHIINGDTRYATVVASVVGLVALVSDAALRGLRHGAAHTLHRSVRRLGPLALVPLLLLAVFALLAPLSAKLVQMAISRQREFLADATSVRLTRNPLGLVSALEKLNRDRGDPRHTNRAVQHMFIVNPRRDFSAWTGALMATHPPIERRIQRLLHLGARI
jgi:heat shock protein HtpX